MSSLLIGEDVKISRRMIEEVVRRLHVEFPFNVTSGFGQMDWRKRCAPLRHAMPNLPHEHVLREG
jgi:hypothetical protein